MAVPGMKNTGRVIAGVGKVYVAPLGETWPVVTGDALTWGGAWVHLTEETDGGFELSYKETNTPHKIDQQLMPILYTPDSAEGSLTLSMASMDHTRLQYLISNATLTPVAAGVGTVGLSKLGIGGSALREFQIGIEGLAPENPPGSAFWELIQIWKVIPSSELKKTYKKGSKQMVEGVFQLCADLTQAATETVFRITHKTADAET
jgi:hypothetical protein